MKKLIAVVGALGIVMSGCAGSRANVPMHFEAVHGPASPWAVAPETPKMPLFSESSVGTDSGGSEMRSGGDVVSRPAAEPL